MQSLSSVENSEPIYSSINSLNTDEDEDEDAPDELPDDADTITNDEKDDLVCEINLHAYNYTLCKSKAAHDDV